MKNTWIVLLVAFGLSMVAPETSQAQLLKGFGRKVENKLKQKVEQKADRHVDKTINTADKKSDASIEQAVKGDGNKAETNKKENKSQNKSQNKKVNQNSKALDQNIPVRKDLAINMFNSSACNDFLWFKKGTLFEYEMEGLGDNDNHSASMLVKDITHSGGKTIAEIVASQQTDDGNVGFTLHYICDGNNFYIDMSAMTEQIMQQINTEGGEHNTQIKEAIDTAEFDISEGFTAIPKVLYPGLRLPDASFSFSMNMSGMDMQMNSIVTDRVVEAKESITTSAGTFECMKIRSTSQVSMQMMGRIINTQTCTDYTWLAPEIGLVKQELYTKNKLEYSTELTGLNKVK